MFKYRGFNLLEILIVVALIAILSNLGYASWQHHLRRSYDMEAQESLYTVATTLEECYLYTHHYRTCAQSLDLLNDSPLSSQKNFTLVIKEVSSDSYLLTAAPRNDKGGTWLLDNSGLLRKDF